MYYIFQTPATIEELASICKTPNRLLKWMRFRIRHSRHDNIINPPAKTLPGKKCSHLEFAWLFYEALNKLGIFAYILTVSGSAKSVACAFDDEDGKIKCMVNRRLMLRTCKKIENAPDYIDRDWYRWIEWAILMGRLVPVKPHYRNGADEASDDTGNYLLRNRLSSVR